VEGLASVGGYDNGIAPEVGDVHDDDAAVCATALHLLGSESFVKLTEPRKLLDICYTLLKLCDCIFSPS
jgi:hypothetical protein